MGPKSGTNKSSKPSNSAKSTSSYQTNLRNSFHTTVQTRHSSKNGEKKQAILDNFLKNKNQLHEIQNDKLRTVLKKISIEQILTHCPILQQLLKIIKNQCKNISNKLLQSLIHKYLYFSHHTLLCDKYRPAQIAQLLQPKFGQKLKKWLQSYFEYHRTIQQIREQSNNYMDSSQQYSYNISNMVKNQHYRDGLLIWGREGVGKKTLIRVVCQEQNLQLLQYTNDSDQIQVLKQRNESTQSQSIKIVSKMRNKVQRSNHNINSFLIHNQESNNIENNSGSNNNHKMIRKVQLVHNFNRSYPEEKRLKFNKQLSKAIIQSKTPFIMTLHDGNIEDMFNKCDIMYYQEAKDQILMDYIWAILQIQYKLENINLDICIDDKNNVFDILNKELKNTQFKQSKIQFTINQVKQLCFLQNNNLNHIFTLLELHFKTREKVLNIKKQASYYVSQVNCESLLSQFYNYQNKIIRYYSAKMKQKQIFVEQQHQPCLQKSITCNNIDSSILNDSFQQIYLRCQFDSHHRNNPQNIFICDKFLGDDQWQISMDDIYRQIPIKVHKKIKKKLLKKIRFKVISQLGQKFSLKCYQLSWMKLMFGEVRNNLRNNKIPYILKWFEENQIRYLKNYCGLVINSEIILNQQEQKKIN